MILLEERHPQNPLHSEVVLHVRRHLRRQITAREQAHSALQLIFNLEDTEAESLRIDQCLQQPDPLRAAAQKIGDARGVRTVSLAYDEAFVARCRSWLLQRKQSERAFSGILATDLRTLLELSKALDFAAPQVAGMDGRGAPPILILGETGTGKELLATAIHEIWCRQLSLMPKPPTMKVLHVAGMPPDVITDELFGHAKGAYTNAYQERKGRLEEASGSTLLIDEVGDLPPEAQVQLLRFLQDQKLSRLGDNELRQVQVRILTATLHDLERLVKEHRFRLDLLHRLRVGQIRLPPLREREDAFRDVVPLMLDKLGQQAKPQLTRSALDALAGYSWPGNLRELDGVLRAALISSRGDTIRLEDLPAQMQVTYLNRPAPERIPGILLDDLGDEPVGQDVLKERVAYASSVLDEGMTEHTVSTGHWSKLVDLLHAIPDSADEHAQAVGELQELAELERRQQSLDQMTRIWGQVQSSGLPKRYAPYVKAELARLNKELRVVSNVFQRAAAREQDLKARSPWLRLFAELESHPVRKHVPNWGALIQSLVTVIRLLSAFAPEAISWLRNALSQGGLDGLRKTLLELIKAARENADGQEAYRSVEDDRFDRPYKSWDAKDWAELAAKYSSLSEIKQQFGIDPDTVKKYFRKHRIQPAWRLQPRGVPSESQ